MNKRPELTPLEDNRPEVGPHKETAGGIPAILSSMKHIFSEAGVVRGTKELLALNQMKGYDCPGCAWPDPDTHRAVTEFCENGAKAIAEEATTIRADEDFFKVHSVKELAKWSDYHIGKSGRIMHPMYLKEGGTHYEKVSWDQAFEIIAEELNALSSPDEAIFYTSGRTSNEAAFAYQLFVRLFGTNNLPDCSNMCHESSGVSLTESIGIGKGSVTLNDFDHADCILIIGQNPGTNHPRMLTTLGEAAARGAKIISINPLFETGVQHFIHPQHFWRWFGKGQPIATLHMPIRVNGDIAVLKGIMKELLIAEDAAPGTVFDHKFIRDKTDGFESLIADLRETSWDVITEQSGIARDHIKAAADVIRASKAVIACWAMGITQQTHGVEAIRQIVNLLLLGGHFGRPGAGACPVRGHSNVQGDRTVGIYEKPSQAFLDDLQKRFKFVPPQEHGLDAVESIKSMYKKETKVFFAMGGNFLSATPDTDFTAEALRNMNLTVHVSTKTNRSHFVHGKKALILPALGRTEIDEQKSGQQFVTVEDSMSVIHSSLGNLNPGKDQDKKSEIAIVCGLAQAVFKNIPEKRDIVNWQAMEENYDVIRDHIEAVVPGFKDYNERVRKPGGFYLPHSVRDSAIFRTTT
ncbi:MAG: FdhF/YdeP family oxidoreductase, partial [Proteobacteria bacterium]